MDETQTPSARFHQLLAEAWEFRLREDPLFATRIGDHRFNDRLPGASEADYERRLERMREFRRRQGAIDRQALTPGEGLNFDVFARMLDREIAELEFRAYRMPISKSGGFHIWFPILPRTFTPLDSVGDYENYSARLWAFRRFVDECIGVMQLGIRDGQTPARVTLEGVDDQLQAQIVDAPAESALYEPFERYPQAIHDPDRQRLTEAGADAIMGSVAPAYRELLTFLQDEYRPAAREEVGASGLPDGRAFYQHRIRYYTSLDRTPEEVHETGQSEVRRIRAEMEEVIRKVGFEGTTGEFIDFLRTDPRFYAKTPEALLKEVAYVLKSMDGQLPRLFKTLPRMSYGIRSVPDFSAPASPTAYYMEPAGDGTQAGMYYVNTYDLESRPLYEIEALSLHEAVPGHHLQIALQQELSDLPGFRRFGDFTAFQEGWALYAERLGLEVGFYEDPYSDFGRLSYEMWRACRLVVDTGMHTLGWTRQQAIDFMAENTSLTPLNIANEVDRYIAWPGQALAYKIGELKIRELRDRAEKALGDRFDLRAFHEVLLGDGPLPLDLLETSVARWLEGLR